MQVQSAIHLKTLALMIAEVKALRKAMFDVAANIVVSDQADQPNQR